jgi:UDP-N-acetylmuramoyl-L-alanyl-D-glutamate--2,6-diaminopimelate ligase
MWIYETLLGVDLVERVSSMAEVQGVRYDSRKVGTGDLFVAMCGGSTDGNRYIAAALENGAVAVVTDSREAWNSGRLSTTPFYLVKNGRRALAAIAANLLGHPERALKISAVTGTNGKTTTAFLLEQMLRSVNRKCVLIGTIETHVGNEVRPSEHTTPEASDLLNVFADGVKVGATEAVMEMSSHALDQERVWGVHVDVAIFTNLTQDHLDFHGTMEAYAAAKARMFSGVGAAPPRIAVINADDAFSALILKSAEKCPTIWTYGLENASTQCHPIDFFATQIKLGAGQTSFHLRTPFGELQVNSHLSGRVNVYNLVAAIAAGLGRGMTLDQIRSSIDNLHPVPGRFQTIPNQQGITVVVDYAHTDDALRNLIGLARELVKPTGGRVITLFGCGGDRDRTKRPRMGRAAGEGSDLVVLTSDNPRSEDPATILEEAFAGVRETATEVIVESDRATAIRLAISNAQRGDIVLLAGKGHEKIQILCDGTVPFDDVKVAAQVLEDNVAIKEQS